MLQQLLQQADFLKLTLANPLASPTASATIAGHTQVELWDSGVVVFSPLAAVAHHDIVLSCGIHGNETAPIELCNRLIHNIIKQTLPLRQRVMFIFGNPPAMIKGTRFVEENLNRLFNGAHGEGNGPQNAERQRAARLEHHVRRFFETGGGQRLHYDLHTAIRASRHERFAVCPYRPGKPHSKRQLALLNAGGVEAFLLHHEPTTTFSYASSANFAAEAFTVELGKVHPFGQNDPQQLAPMQALLSNLLSQPQLPDAEFQPETLMIYRVCRVITKHYPDFAFTFDGRLPNFTRFAKGEVLAMENGQPVVAEHDDEAIVFPNSHIPVGQRAALCVVPEMSATLA
ncbi:succinylglutamate desuccinylase [Shewanella sp. YIC-542]|uniref:succinylglutamate desuccinylase n=1 Tax=Shewanella mytili TaxID=3377111 RepID=UPI00398E9BAF